MLEFVRWVIKYSAALTSEEARKQIDGGWKKLIRAVILFMYPTRGKTIEFVTNIRQKFQMNAYYVFLHNFVGSYAKRGRQYHSPSLLFTIISIQLTFLFLMILCCAQHRSFVIILQRLKLLITIIS